MHIRESRSDRITKAVCYVFVGLFALACLLPVSYTHLRAHET